MYTYTHTTSCIHMKAQMRIHTNAYIHVHAHTPIITRKWWVCLHQLHPFLPKRTHTHTQPHTYTHIHTHTHTHAHTHTHTHTHTHAHTHTHTHTHTQTGPTSSRAVTWIEVRRDTQGGCKISSLVSCPYVSRA